MAPEIARLIPHRGAMCLLDSVADQGPEWVETRVRVCADGPFGADGTVGAWVGIEYMAQAVAAFSGLRSHAAGDAPGIGLLVGTRAYHAGVGGFPAGAMLCVRAERRYESDDGLASFACSIRDADGALLAEAALTVFQPADPRVLFDGMPA